MDDKIIPIFIIIVAAFLSYIGGVKIYFKQKEYELVRKRYLEDGLDLLSENVDQVLSIFRTHWAYSVSLLREFEALGKDTPLKSYSEKFPQFEENIFRLMPFSRLRYLINDQVFWEAIQQLNAFVENSIAYFRIDLSNAIKFYCETDKIEISHKEIANLYLEGIVKIEKDSHNYYEVVTGLSQLSLYLEREKFSFKKLEIFRDKEDVKSIVNNFKENFVFKTIKKKPNNATQAGGKTPSINSEDIEA
jgi:hypothetical protein